MTLYKTFRGRDLSRLTGCYGYGAYDLSRLPVVMPRLDGEPVLCERGYHACRREHLVHHLSDVIAVVEAPEWQDDLS